MPRLNRIARTGDRYEGALRNETMASRAAALRLALTLATVGTALPACAARGDDGGVTAAGAALDSALPDGAPVLRLPVRAGSVMFCQQGNDTGAGHSHSDDNTRFALDLSTPGVDGAVVVAAAAGRVARIVTGATPGGVDPGAGFGNQVVVEHPNGFFTLYAHLSRVDIAMGVTVSAGDALGIMGETGKAGNVHVHFSMHKDLPPDDGIGQSVPMDGILTADVSGDSLFELRQSRQFVCGPSEITPDGHIYASENGGGPAVTGAIPASLAGVIEANRAAMATAIAEVDDPAVDAILADRDHDPVATTVARLAAYVDGHPATLLGRYWYVVEALQTATPDRDRIRAALGFLDQPHPMAPDWLAPWTVLREGQFALLEGRKDDARRLLDQASQDHNEGADYDRILADALAKLGTM
jgi:murein DD-endopeptidase MepM/ murein hydrolase activator NlpD